MWRQPATEIQCHCWTPRLMHSVTPSGDWYKFLSIAETVKDNNLWFRGEVWYGCCQILLYPFIFINRIPVLFREQVPGKIFNCLKALAAKRSHVTHSGEMETEVYLKIKYIFFFMLKKGRLGQLCSVFNSSFAVEDKCNAEHGGERSEGSGIIDDFLRHLPPSCTVSRFWLMWHQIKTAIWLNY